MEPDKPDTLAHAEFKLEDQYFVALDSAHKHEFNLNEGISLMLFLEDQQEIDYYWDKLSAVPEAEQCGWVKINSVSLGKLSLKSWTKWQKKVHQNKSVTLQKHSLK